MIEVEAKAKINSFEEIIKELKKLNVEKNKTETQTDIYFNSPIVDFAKTDEALRIRKVNTDEKEELFITYKGPKIDKKSKTREEIEMEIEDEEKCKKIFMNLGFTNVRTVKKTRDYYDLNEYSISLDNVEGLEPYMEIETILKDGADYTEAQENIFKIFKKLGITEGFERTSYLELLENKDKNL